MKTKQTSRILVDTNIVIRALIDDNDIFQKLVENSDEVHIPLPVFFEIVFVLEKIHRQTRITIVDYLSTVISYENIITENDTLKEVMEIYLNNTNLSVIDCFLLIYADKNKVELKTLDKSLAKAT